MVKVVKPGIKRPARSPLPPDPEPREVAYTLLSVDDHVLEPPHTFEGRLPRRLQDGAPRVVETEEGHQVREFEGQPYFQVGFMCVAGMAREDYRMEPARYDEVRVGCYDVDARIKDMDLGGIWASVNFPSGVTGFGGTLFSDAKDRALGLACMRAWDDWIYEEWCSAYPDRIVPLGVTFLADAEKGPRRSGGTLRAAFSRSRSPNSLTASAIRPCSMRTRNPSCAPAPRPGRCLTSTSARRASPRCRPAPRRSSWAPPSSAPSPCSPVRSGCGAAGPPVIPISRSRCPRETSAGSPCSRTVSTTS